MIVHIVLFKLKEPTAENVALVRDKLLSMDGKVPMLLQLEVGVDVIRSERSYDVALYTRFASLEDLQAYQVHPYHAGEVVPVMKASCSSVVAADYEV
ncbi:MAG TPA: Dabb family protein [Geobacteraceae bacterium]|nr:Dabb family protein [Geobacteraceae bacterium]